MNHQRPDLDQQLDYGLDCQERTTACDCQRTNEPALSQTLFLMSDEALLTNVNEGLLQRLLSSGLSDEQIVEELFLATFSRFPTADKLRSARLLPFRN